MATIFLFSARPADESNGQSDVFCRAVAAVLVPGYSQMDASQQETAASQYQHVVRKCAHATEYLVLGVLCSVAALETRKSIMRSGPARGGKRHSEISERRGIAVAGLFAFVLSVLYAASDEVHQLFVLGRLGQVTDVLIDASGVVVGVVVVLLIAVKREKSVGGGGR